MQRLHLSRYFLLFQNGIFLKMTIAEIAKNKSHELMSCDYERT